MNDRTEPGVSRPWTSAPVVITIVALLAFAVYANSLANGLHVDDQQQIVDNVWIKDVANLGEIFTSGVWDHAGRVSSYYRPIMYVLYMTVYMIFGVSPVAFHLLNVALHVAASVLVVSITWTITIRGDSRVSPFLTSLVVGLLFAAHPIHTEAVAWAAGIADLSYSVFALLSLYWYVRPRDRWGLRTVGSALAFFLAALCKEPALTLPVLLVAFDLLVRRERFSPSRVLVRLLPFLVATAVYMVLRYKALGGLAPVTTEVSFAPYYYLINVLSLFSRYVEALVVPVDLNFWHVFHPLESLASAEGLRVLSIVAAFVMVAGVAAWKCRPALFGLIAIVVPLLPSFHVSALNQGLENAFAERYLYLPSFGFVLVAGAFVAWVQRNRPRAMRGLLAVIAVVVVLYSVGTIRRNAVWRDSYTLWSDVVQKSPGSAVAHMNYGFALLARGRSTEGRDHLKTAVELDPGRVDLKVQNGIAYSRRGLYKQAILELHAALTMDPDCFEAHYNLGVLYERQRWTDLAVSHYARALEIEPGFADAHNNLGILYAERGDLARAEGHFREANRLNPDHPDYRANLEKLRGMLAGP